MKAEVMQTPNRCDRFHVITSPRGALSPAGYPIAAFEILVADLQVEQARQIAKQFNKREQDHADR
ncbi:hypothetical protein [Azoarcus taiwanensis]|uniref:Uncharacterized protein n=1 Tax=Azoarcus taiwanensis TaxID=666964 RepID=A0A972F9Z4_9RHOO|nr:hypothetical protein [Azoarcus taiwanensis]NMG05104.1 hypothetical protein [Azoarcus taiwanensis]